MRSKWKGSQELREKLAASGNEEITEDREPILEGFAPDYDLRLFREAQALAAIKIEEELGDIPTDKGTRYVFGLIIILLCDNGPCGLGKIKGYWKVIVLFKAVI